ncbi:MAG: hypothetical protein Kow0060_15090 [Methylohalobius crimeensis]
MIVTLHTQGLKTLAQVQAFVSSNEAISFTLTDRAAAYGWMTDTLKQFHYGRCTRADKGVLRQYLRKVTGFSRALKVHGDARFERLASISNGHLYNLRQHTTYQTKRGSFDKTRPTKVNIGERRKPAPDGCPGYLRVDSVHQGDLDGIKGVYLINAVDEVTQFQAVFAVERISEAYLLPVLEAMTDTFPFVLRLGVHQSPGGETTGEIAYRADQITFATDQ